VLPLVSGMLGQERVVGASYYVRAAGPLFLLLLALMAAGPLLPWRRGGSRAARAVGWAGGGGGIALFILLGAGVRSLPALIAFPLAVAVATTCAMQYAALLSIRGGLKSRPRPSLPAALLRHRRRYGAYLAHLGLVVLVVGVAGSQLWQQERDVTLAPNQSVTVAGYTVTYTGAEQRQLADHSELVGSLRFGDETLQPSLASYAGLGGQALTHVAISTTPVADLYVVLAGVNDDGSASFRIFVNPLVTWIWAGGAIIILGVVLGNLGDRSAATETAARRVAELVPG
jgi:cytochrome c-type biogenesis protein CcmF